MTGRYDEQARILVPQDDGTTSAYGVPRVSVPPQIAAIYQVHDGDRLDGLAATALGASTAWWRIADANTALDPLRLERTGTIIGVPGA